MLTKVSSSLLLLAILITSCVQNSPEYDRYCFTLDLVDNAQLIDEYKKIHTPENMWPEIPKGIKEAGCNDMEIYLVHNRMFLIAEIAKGADIDSVWNEMGKKERQDQWASFVRKFQQSIPKEDPTSSWILMEKVYDLDDYFPESSID